MTKETLGSVCQKEASLWACLTLDPSIFSAMLQTYICEARDLLMKRHIYPCDLLPCCLPRPWIIDENDPAFSQKSLPSSRSLRLRSILAAFPSKTTRRHTAWADRNFPGFLYILSSSSFDSLLPTVLCYNYVLVVISGSFEPSFRDSSELLGQVSVY